MEKAIELDLDPPGRKAFEYLSKCLPELASELSTLGSLLSCVHRDMVSDPPILDVEKASVPEVAESFSVLKDRIKDQLVRDLFSRCEKRLLGLAPISKVDESAMVAIRLPEDLAKQFPPKQEDGSPPHSTVLFIGDVDPSGFEKVLHVAREVAQKVSPFRVQMTDYGEFKNQEGKVIPHMIPRSDQVSLEALHGELRKAIESAGITVAHQPGPFKAHVTLAYSDPGTSYSGPRPSGEFDVTEIEVWGGDHGNVVVPLGIQKVSKGDSFEGRVEILKGSECEGQDQRTVFGIVLEPETVDSQGELYSEEEVQKTAWNFVENHQKFGLMHREILPGIMLLESYCSPVAFEVAGQSVKKGTWLMRVRVIDDGVWKDVKSRRMTGFSIGGTATRIPELTR